MENKNMRHEIVSENSDIEVKFYLSVDEGGYVTPHWHNSLEIVYMLEGSITVTLENKKVTTLLPEEFIIINSRTVHSFTSKKNRALVLQIPSTMFEKYVRNIDLFYFTVDMNPKDETEIIKLDKIKKIFHDMYEVYNDQPEGYLLKFNSLLYDMLFTLIHLYSSKLTSKQINKNNKYLIILKEITKFLYTYHNEQITIHRLADKFGYNPDYLSRLFKKYMGLTIIDYLYEIRINFVYKDLIDTDLNISDIFEKHGCSNYKVAMKFFKNRYGCTPKEKRRQINRIILK
ncbi:AraC family transcriptional regulator [Clostridium beijerinckii]|uniref:AraC family transcriptional regulator n=1 Tax=Clostridium beijerinckii TaxID=1520 RepID=UPI0014941B0F|nr:AraC family transcriptional regulator [Clostridium beijerinckii]NOW06666.1 AraC-like DNA-binding protein/quercetin dioxygenase-like cupin family protein [Clostridium beijerinckii]NYC00190.1 AraC-like DNA-binding protein/quercetin dioxygenase-like cupin family protein [Clostridium beijerinckii]